jgi:hypothetical protein
MLDTTFEFRISAAGRQELAALAATLGVSAADVIRLGIRRVAAEHMPVARPPVAPAPVTAPQFEAMDTTTLLALRDVLARQNTPEASRSYTEVNTEIIKRDMAANANSTNDPSEFTQRRDKDRVALLHFRLLLGEAPHQHADPARALRRLCASGERPRCRAAN